MKVDEVAEGFAALKSGNEIGRGAPATLPRQGGYAEQNLPALRHANGG